MYNQAHNRFDYLTLFLYLVMVFLGIGSIYAAQYASIEEHLLPLLKQCAFKQFIFLMFTLSGGLLIMLVDSRLFHGFAYLGYLLSIAVLLGTSILGRKIGGHHTWYQLGIFWLQPTEFAKVSCLLAIARYLGHSGKDLKNWSVQFMCIILILLPAGIVVLQGDLGSGLVFLSLFLILYREDLPVKWVLLGVIPLLLLVSMLLFPTIYLVIFLLIGGFIVLGLWKRTKRNIMIITGTVLSCLLGLFAIDQFIYKTLKPYQRERLQALVNPNRDPRGSGWNTTQAKIAVGAGGWLGKGLFKGTQTQHGFVPAQKTDFIFCTIGEEFGFLGSTLVLFLFILLLYKIIFLAERQRSRFVRVYAYGVFSILAFHFIVNIGMTIGLMPVIGIPLPFFSYGGSALCAFSLMLFLLLKFDGERKRIKL